MSGLHLKHKRRRVEKKVRGGLTEGYDEMATLGERLYTLYISRYMGSRHPIGRCATEQQPRIHDHNIGGLYMG
jgi:hypothetical protein